MKALPTICIYFRLCLKVRFGPVFSCPGALTVTITGLPFPQKSKDQTGPQKDRRPRFFAVYRPVSVCISFNRFMTGL
ncbi:uncharacterized protein LACBIDRAFT_317618 [Laccaria bicolor S238N-H82]|uniref:Predicted protein n=1 Tax=Laccaria bicolor (strain S238N-H82 / ATCC MYA-4686) TaxID=486041 RepID=B0E221_LACBS|nr:uncharacterized protein LACBIDRAFT_317618 [Laccaria bicolor S238N-H82]EDQ99118.1 predicted protein [Laccaria bicolor S238N-H82]|eukprot:XP_001890251.1 predicted protein [Laccaria bicolor S238N-H82]